METKRRLKNFDFSAEGAHMALVGEFQNGAANGYKTLITKSLTNDLTEEQKESLKQIIKSAQECSDEEAEAIIKAHLDTSKNTQGDSKTPLSENLETPDEVDNMTTDNVEMIEKSVSDAALQEVQKAADTAKAEVEELKKSLKAFEEAKAEAEKQEFIVKAQGFESLGVTEENTEAFAVALMKMSKDEDLSVIQEVLEKAVTIAKSVGDLEPVGVDTQVEAETGNSALAEILKAKFNK